MKEEQISGRKRLRKLPQAIDRRIPQKVDSLYENHWAGNLIAYPTDPDPVRGDEVYRKLEELSVHPQYWGYRGDKSLKTRIRARAGQVAFGLQQSMMERKMNERTYNHISKTPLWRLRLEYALATVIDDMTGRGKVEEEQFYARLRSSYPEHERKVAIAAYLKPVEWVEHSEWDFGDEDEVN